MRYGFLTSEQAKTIGATSAPLLDPTYDTFSYREALRMAVDSLQLKYMEGKAELLMDVSMPTTQRMTKDYIKAISGMREAGFTSAEILEHMIAYQYGGVSVLV